MSKPPIHGRMPSVGSVGTIHQFRILSTTDLRVIYHRRPDEGADECLVAYTLRSPSLYRFGDNPVCFLKNVPKADTLGNPISTAMSCMGLPVAVSRKMARRVMALKTSSCTVYPQICLTSEERYLGDRHSLSA